MEFHLKNAYFVAATRQEIEVLPHQLQENALICGAGIPMSMHRLTSFLSELASPAFIIHTGICGAYPNVGIVPGDIVHITQECFADLGKDTPQGFASLESMGFMPSGWQLQNFYTPAWKQLEYVTAVKGATVNTCCTTLAQLAIRRDQLDCQVESMEGAACALATQLHHHHFLQIRAVSNYADTPENQVWNIPMALNALKKFWNEIYEDCNKSLS
jgi:futalosine hydrolase